MLEVASVREQNLFAKTQASLLKEIGAPKQEFYYISKPTENIEIGDNNRDLWRLYVDDCFQYIRKQLVLEPVYKIFHLKNRLSYLTSEQNN